MPSTLELRRRIRSVRSTKQITKAMELVSASKMRRASEATLASRPYTEKSWQIISDIIKSGQVNHQEISHPLLTVRPIKKTLAIVISSDRGLAGIYNAAIIKKIQELENSINIGSLDFFTIGQKAASFLTRSGKIILQSYPQPGTQPHLREIQGIAHSVIKDYTAQKYDQVILIYTDFVSLLSQQATTQKLLPLSTSDLPENSEKAYEFLYEPTAQEVLDHLLPRLVETQLYQALLESVASEHAARRIAMKNATDNANDIIDDLTLTYNGIRQSAITQELAEITSGAAALTT